MDLETGDNATPNKQSNEPIFADSSGPFFTLYSEAAEDEDNKMVKSWQEDAKGILIFTGLFSAAVAAILTLTVQDLRPNSQDTSAFYLGNIYEVLADPNVTRASPVAKPPPFSRPRYAIWANSLLFLSLIIGLSCALLATSLQQWARRYIRLTQLARTSPERRARMREFYANGVDKMHTPWAVEGLPTLLHLSLFLFFGGLAVFLFNVDVEVFTCVICWIGLFSIIYGLITLLPLIRLDSPYYTPLSKPVWFLNARIQFVKHAVHLFFRYVFLFIRHRRGSIPSRYLFNWTFRGMEEEAEEKAKESSKIVIRILDWTMSALGDDNSQEKFFQTIPGLFSSDKYYGLENVPQSLLFDILDALRNFITDTQYSNSVSEEVKKRRGDIRMDIGNVIPCSFIPYPDNFGPKPLSIDRVMLMARWLDHESPFASCIARVRVADMLARLGSEERGELWMKLASEVSGISEDELRLDLAHAGVNLRLATVIHTCRKTFRFSYDEFDRMMGWFIADFGKFDIRHTLPRLQHDFCQLWNDLVQEARKAQSLNLSPVVILFQIHRHYISLHQGTDTALLYYENMLFNPSSIPLCDLSRHPDSATPPIPGDLPDASPHSTPGGSTVSRHDEEGIIAGSPSRPHSTTSTIIRDNCQVPAATDSHTTDESPPDAVVTALQDISPDAMVSYALRGAAHSVPAVAASASNLLLPTSYVINLSITAVPPPSHVPPLTAAEPVTLPGTTTPFHPADNATPPRLRSRGLVNTGGMCFSNAVLQLLVHSPPFWDVFRELENMKGQLGGGGPETATPLVDATVTFFEEFMFKEKNLPSTQQPPQQAVREIQGEDEGEKKEHKNMDSTEPTYMYEAMKEKSQLKVLLDGKNYDAEEFLRLYLAALDEEWVKLQTYIGTVSAPSEEKLEGAGQTEAKARDYMASSFKSPISHIFGGRSRSTGGVPNQPDTVTIEAWRSLQLNIQPDSAHTIQDGVARVSQPKFMQVVQSSSSSNEATQEVLLEVLPSILVLRPRHSPFDEATERINKISKPVWFGPQPEIPLEMMVPAAGNSTKPIHYKLHGVLYHHGESAGNGHYTVDVLQQNGDSGGGEAWLHIDDEAVREVRHEAVFGGHDNERVDNQCVHMLFYSRTDPAKA